MHWSQFAHDLDCQHCWKKNIAYKWPLGGDGVPFVFKKEKGDFSMAVNCPHCGKEWYVVWDANPEPVKPLTF